MGIASIYWCKDNHFSKETTMEEGSATTNPKSPLDVNFEKETGVTTGLGLVPYLAKLWEEDPYNRRIVFGIDMGVDLFSRSLIELSVANTFELISISLNTSARLFSCPSPPSSPFLPVSHTTLIGSTQPDMNLPDQEMPLDPEYVLFIRDGNHETADLSVAIPIDSEFQDDLDLREKHSEHMYDDSFAGIQAQTITHLAHEEKNTPVIANPTATHIQNNHTDMKKPRSFIGGLSAIFGVRANKPEPNLENYQYPSEAIMHDA